MRCGRSKELRKEFLQELIINLIKHKSEQISINDIFDMREDMLMHLKGGEEDEYETNQAIVGMQNLFRGFIIKALKGSNFSVNSYHKLTRHWCGIVPITMQSAGTIGTMPCIMIKFKNK